MVSGLVSPERCPVKVTYTGKKRRPSRKDNTVEESDESPSEAEVHQTSDGQGKANVKGKHKIPLDLPGPEPRAKHVGSKENLGEKTVSPRAPNTTGRSVKPPSASTVGSKTPLASNGGVPFPPAPDISDKETASRAPRTTEAERRAYLESHPDVAELEPHRVLCRCCNKWLRLSATQNYALAPWKLHKKACTSEKPRINGLPPNADPTNDFFVKRVEEDDASSIAPSISASETTGVSVATRRLLMAERQRLLEEDELSGEVRTDAVYCSACAKWIKLSNRTAYQLRNWIRHAEQVHERAGSSSEIGHGPSNRVREAERKLQLVNDSQARDFTTSRVTCKTCSAEVTLSEFVPYQLDNWLAHKAVCSSSHGSSQQASTSPSIGSRENAVKSTSSTASTDVTCVAGENAADTTPPSGFSTIGQKRHREEDENDDTVKVARTRTASYMVPDEKPSGPWGWLKLPWETFKRGFVEGLGAVRGESSRADS